jgi:hypothetical protein
MTRMTKFHVSLSAEQDCIGAVVLKMASGFCSAPPRDATDRIKKRKFQGERIKLSVEWSAKQHETE